MPLVLERPLAFFDLETTGTNVAQDRIVEIAIIKLFPDGSEEEYCKRVNPEMEIPEEVSEIHGIYNKDVATAPTFADLAQEVEAFIEGCDLAGYNSNRFDVPVLAEEFLRAGLNLKTEERKLLDAQAIFHKMEARTLEAALKFYCGEKLENAHSALADTRATLDVLKAQVDRYDELEGNTEFLAKFTHSGKKNLDNAGRFVLNKEGKAIFNFGKFKGKLVQDVLKEETGYYGWMLNADFALDTKNALKRIKEEGL